MVLLARAGLAISSPGLAIPPHVNQLMAETFWLVALDGRRGGSHGIPLERLEASMCVDEMMRKKMVRLSAD